MADWMNLGQQFKVNARKYPHTVALKDAARSYTYAQANRRVNRLAHGLMALGLQKGDKVAVLLENSIEIIELYLATAKTGLVIVPINFRLVGREVEYIVNNSDAKALMVHDEFVPVVEEIRERSARHRARALSSWWARRHPLFQSYDELIAAGTEQEPQVAVAPRDTWILIYTSGTTGKPKGVVRSHETHIAFYLINAIDFGFSPHDICMNVMPLCHINSTFFTFTFLYIGAAVYIHPARSFRAEEILEIIEGEKISFISLIPTHYNLMLNADPSARQRDVSSIRKLLVLVGAGAQEHENGHHGFFPRGGALRGIRLHRGRYRHRAKARGPDCASWAPSATNPWGPISSNCSTSRAMRCPTAKWVNSTPAVPCCSTSTTNCRRKRPRPFGRAGFRPATWPAATPTGFTRSLTARTT